MKVQNEDLQIVKGLKSNERSHSYTTIPPTYFTQLSHFTVSSTYKYLQRRSTPQGLILNPVRPNLKRNVHDVM